MKKQDQYRHLDRQRSRINALGTVFAKTDRILTGNREITVAIKAPKGVPSNAPAWSDGKNISINENLVKDLGEKGTLMTLLGLNYHELCHIIYTPRINSWGGLVSWVRNNGFHMTFNILEDQRIETLFTAIYSPARHYFVQMVLEHIMSDKKSWDHAHVLVHGRRYLPASIRKEFAAKWHDPFSTAEVARIIDAYRTLDLSENQNTRTAMLLIQQLNKILKKMPQQDQNKLNDESSCQQQDAESGEPDKDSSSSASSKAKQNTKEQDEKEEKGEDGSGFWDDSEDEKEENSEEGDEDEDGNGSGDDSDGKSDESESESSEKDDSDGNSNDESGSDDDSEESRRDDDSDEDGDSGDDGEGEGDGKGNNKESGSDDEVEKGGHGVGGGGSMSTEELEDELDDILNAAANSEQTTEDVRQLHDAMNDPNNFDLDAVSANTRLVPIPSHIRNASKRVGDEFRRLYAEMEPGWKYGSDEGRLNVNRAMYSEDGEEIWDEWDEGRQESAGLEVVIALDISVSMSTYARSGNYGYHSGTPIMAACQSVWVLKRSCEELGATVSVVGFGLGASTIIPRHEKAKLDKCVYVATLEGDTKPAEAMGIARWVLSQSSQPNKLFVIVTDGIWGPTMSGAASRYLGGNTVSNTYGDWQSASVFQHTALLAEIPGTKVFLGIGQECQPEYVDKFDVVRTINNAEEIVPVVKAAIESMIRKVK